MNLVIFVDKVEIPTWNQMFYLAVSVEVSAFGSSAGFGASAGFGFGFTIIRTIKPFSVKL